MMCVKAISCLLKTLPLLLGTIGCVSSYKHVMVSVVDSTTGAPVEGAKVTTSYWDSAFWHASPHTSEAITGKTGTALLSANYSAISPEYNVHILNDKYQVDTIWIRNEWRDAGLRARPETFIPTTPDIVVNVNSREVDARISAENEKRRAADQERRKMDEQKAEELFEKSPDFWPDHYLGRIDHVGELLLSKRWNSASTKSLGTKADTDAIRAVVLLNMKTPKAEVHEIRWLSPTLVMVSSSWNAGSLGSGEFWYVLQKGEYGWIVSGVLHDLRLMKLKGDAYRCQNVGTPRSGRTLCGHSETGRGISFFGVVLS